MLPQCQIAKHACTAADTCARCSESSAEERRLLDLWRDCRHTERHDNRVRVRIHCSTGYDAPPGAHIRMCAACRARNRLRTQRMLQEQRGPLQAFFAAFAGSFQDWVPSGARPTRERLSQAVVSAPQQAQHSLGSKIVWGRAADGSAPGSEAISRN